MERNTHYLIGALAGISSLAIQIFELYEPRGVVSSLQCKILSGSLPCTFFSSVQLIRGCNSDLERMRISSTEEDLEGQTVQEELQLQNRTLSKITLITYFCSLAVSTYAVTNFIAEYVENGTPYEHGCQISNDLFQAFTGGVLLFFATLTRDNF